MKIPRTLGSRSFIFPGHIKGQNQLLYFQQKFVDEYRKNLEEFLEKFKEKYPEDTESFQRYTLILDDEIKTVSCVDENEIFHQSDIRKSKEIYIGTNATKGAYSKEGYEYKLKNNDSIKEKKYKVQYAKDEKKINLITYFKNKLHLSPDTSYINTLDEEDLSELEENFDFMIIETSDKKICIKANISLENKSVTIEPIEGEELEELYASFMDAIVNSQNKKTLNEFFL